MSGWVYMRHPETGGANRFPDSPDVIALYGARGWVLADMPPELDPDAADTGATFPAFAPTRVRTAAPDPEPTSPKSKGATQ